MNVQKGLLVTCLVPFLFAGTFWWKRATKCVSLAEPESHDVLTVDLIF